MFKDGEIEKIIFTLYSSRLRIFLLIINLTFQQHIRLLLILLKNIRFHPLGLILTPLEFIQLPLPRLLLRRHIQKSLHLHIRQYLIRHKAIVKGHFTVCHMSFPTKQEIIRG